jgi:pimeloyl-ACP methyl ester carboxylesterase
LRYDKRGAGESGGDFFAAGVRENHADACAAVGWLATRAGGRPLYAVGHSEGALDVAHLAADERVAGAILIGCPARRGEEILVWQAGRIVPTLPPAIKVILTLLRVDPLRSQQKAFVRFRSTSTDSLRIQGKKLNASWLREFMDYDPVPTFTRIHCPVLVLVAEHDMQVPPEDGAAICSLVAGPSDEVVLPGLSHILRDDPESKGPRGYRKALKAPVSPAALETIAYWIAKQLSEPSTTSPNEDGGK